MKVYINEKDITDKILKCKDIDEVTFLFESIKTDCLLMDETIQHRKQLNELLFDTMVNVFRSKGNINKPHFHYHS